MKSKIISYIFAACGMGLIAISLSANSAGNISKIPSIEQLAQTFFPYQSISLKTEMSRIYYDEDGKLSEKSRHEMTFVYIPSSAEYFSHEVVYRVGKDGKEYHEQDETIVRKDGIRTHYANIHGNKQAFIGKYPANPPLLFHAWMFNIQSCFDLDLYDYTIEVDKSSNMIKVGGASNHDMFFDPRTLDYRKFQFYTSPEKKELIHEALLSDYVKIGAYRFPTKVQHISFYPNGKKSGDHTFIIDPQSISFNQATDENFRVFFAPGTIVNDEINAKRYLVTDAEDVEKKEDAIVKMLDKMLNNAAEQETAPPKN